MTDQGPYQPGDIVNGHILGSDNQWHPLMPGAASPPPGPATPDTGSSATGPSATSAVTAPASDGSSFLTDQGTPITNAQTEATKSGWSGLSRGKKLGIVGAGGLGLLLVAGLAGGGGGESQTPAAGSASATASPRPSATATLSAAPAATPDPDVATYWATLSAGEQKYRCDLYRSADPDSAVDGLTYSTSNPKEVVRAHLEQVCPVPPPPPPKNYASLDERTWQLIAKNPDAYAGQTFLVFGEVTQFDSATGTDAFRADVAHTNTCEYGFFQGDNTILVAGSGVDLTNVVNEDVFAAQVTVLGSYSYDTQIGGNTTVPELQVDSIEVQPNRCEYQ